MLQFLVQTTEGNNLIPKDKYALFVCVKQIRSMHICSKQQFDSSVDYMNLTLSENDVATTYINPTAIYKAIPASEIANHFANLN